MEIARYVSNASLKLVFLFKSAMKRVQLHCLSITIVFVMSL